MRARPLLFPLARPLENPSMNPSLRFRQTFAARLMKIAALAALATPLAMSCGGKVVVDRGGDQGDGGAGGAGPGGAGGAFPSTTSTTMTTSSGPQPDTGCFAWPADQP